MKPASSQSGAGGVGGCNLSLISKIIKDSKHHKTLKKNVMIKTPYTIRGKTSLPPQFLVAPRL